MKKILSLALSLLLLAGLAACGEKPPDSVIEPDVPANTALELAEAYTPQPPDKRLALAARQNKDAVAWLTIDGTTIDAAVFQSVDNNYYLRRDDLGNYSVDGCYFADYECRLESAEDMNRNTIIYGHSFDGDAERRFFGQLHRYASDETWAREHRFIKLSLADAMLTYEVVSVGEVDAEADMLSITASPTLDDFSELAKIAVQRSVVDFGTEAAECSQLLTLSTCTGDYATRLLVVARLVSK